MILQYQTILVRYTLFLLVLDSQLSMKSVDMRNSALLAAPVPYTHSITGGGDVESQ
jgi:hypothetical protein